MRIGIDIIEVKRFAKIKKADFKYWHKFFSKREWQYAFVSFKSAERLAGIFAAKEAVMKALGGKYAGRFDLMEILHKENGAPFAKIEKSAKKVFISISHERKYAVAVAVTN
jgi:phosphopantetheine--protein transferase-like protein